jgi:hypothetical protein
MWLILSSYLIAARRSSGDVALLLYLIHKAGSLLAMEAQVHSSNVQIVACKKLRDENIVPLDIHNHELLIAVTTTENCESHVICRTFRDICKLDRMIRKDLQRKGLQDDYLQLPDTKLKNLMDEEWIYLGVGWNQHKTKSLHFVNTWLSSVWNLFSDHFENFANDVIHAETLCISNQKRANEKNARSLQQYFTSNTNVEFMLSFLSYDDLRNSIFVEPSCGDGRIVFSLCNKTGNTLPVIGYDIDSSLLTKAQQINHDMNFNSIFVCSDFLSINRESLLGNFDSRYQDRNIVVIGNPPYTIGGGDGSIKEPGNKASDSGRELPYNFLIHAACTLGASKIIFVLPERCRCESYINLAKLKMQKDVDEWTVTTINAPCNNFNFCERIIHQNCIIQIWDKTVS